MSRIDNVVVSPRRASVQIDDRHRTSPTYKMFFRAEPIERIKMIRAGILASDAKQFLSDLAVTPAAAMTALNISMATLNRREESKCRLLPAESECVIGIAWLVCQVKKIVERSGNAQGFDATAWMSHWLHEPLPVLGDRRPLDLLDTMEGRALVSQTLAQIQSGAYA